jgi:Mlc titration factor MtfA (ptsG expression regulator)
MADKGAIRWLRRLGGKFGGWLGHPALLLPPPIPAPLWQDAIAALPCLAGLKPDELERLRQLSAAFLASKQFHGAQGLLISDEIALAIALQACLPLIHLGADALDWYDDFVGIVVQPDEVLAPREALDEAGVLHRWQEPLIGEAMAGGPVMLAWSHVRGDSEATAQGHNLVIHEFAHKLDLRGKPAGADANGCPPLPADFLGLDPGAARQRWQRDWSAAYAGFRQQVELHERFGQPAPWLDAYAAEAPAEFFACACEAYWVGRERFALEFPQLAPLLDAFFRRPPR